MKKNLMPILLWAAFTCYTLNIYAQVGNTKLGTSALSSNTDGDYNTAIGYETLSSNTRGSQNTATGYRSLRYNNGTANTAGGYASLFQNTNGSNNTAFGRGAMYKNMTGSYNTASGVASLYNNDGSYNTASGYSSLISNTTGLRNTASGFEALMANTAGMENTASGYRSLYLNKGSFNTAYGHESLYTNLYGFYNTALGYYADVSTGGLINATVIGYGAKVDASNKVRIGNSDVNSIGGQVGWTTFSDGRYKKNIKENVQGLAFINSLRPITYTVDVKGLNEYYNKGRNQDEDKEVANNEDKTAKVEMEKAGDAASRIVYNGFVAQEVEEAAKKLNYVFSGVDKPENKDGLYGLRYDNFVAPLVKAVQELSKENDKLKNRVEKLETLLASQSNNSSKTSQTISLTGASLEQNAPNPSSSSTTIHYRIPASVNNAQIMVTSVTGAVIKTFTLATKGAGAVTINAGELAAGSYNYTLIVNGKRVDSKQMMIVR
jgi:hypothetical protein